MLSWPDCANKTCRRSALLRLFWGTSRTFKHLWLSAQPRKVAGLAPMQQSMPCASPTTRRRKPSHKRTPPPNASGVGRKLIVEVPPTSEPRNALPTSRPAPNARSPITQQRFVANLPARLQLSSQLRVQFNHRQQALASLASPQMSDKSKN